MTAQPWLPSYQVRVATHPAFAKVAIPDRQYECWEWRGALSDGYGRKRWKGKTCWAHILARYVAFGDLPEAVCHHCDNRPCINPEHLRAGTLADNCSEMWAK